MRKLTKHLNAEHLKKLMAHLDAAQDTNAALLSLLIRTGMRGEELLKLRLEDIDLTRGTLHITAAKGSRDRVVPVKAPILASIHKALTTGLLGQLKPASLKARLRRELKHHLIKALGFGHNDISLHALRASFAVNLYKKSGNDILLVQELLGHSNINNTLYYVRLSRSEELKPMILKIIG